MLAFGCPEANLWMMVWRKSMVWHPWNDFFQTLMTTPGSSARRRGWRIDFAFLKISRYKTILNPIKPIIYRVVYTPPRWCRIPSINSVSELRDPCRILRHLPRGVSRHNPPRPVQEAQAAKPVGNQGKPHLRFCMMSVLGVSKYRGKPPKMDDWEMEIPIINGWFGENSTIFGNTHFGHVDPVGYFFQPQKSTAASSMQFPLDVARSLEGSFCERCDGYSWHLFFGYQTRLANKKCISTLGMTARCQATNLRRSRRSRRLLFGDFFGDPT